MRSGAAFASLAEQNGASGGAHQLADLSEVSEDEQEENKGTMTRATRIVPQQMDFTKWQSPPIRFETTAI